ncbi:MAG: alkyl hydroperoxide reductase [Micavibrio sp.]|jgi:alkyl hydroperoxide reductase subunit D|nr:MAG: alkyl hydroperoxide reductase [Micavibrio sp.]
MSVAYAEKRADNVQTIDALRELIPDTAKDIRLNLSSVLKTAPGTGLTDNQIWGTALASAYATRHPAVIAAVEGEAADVLSAEEKAAAQSAAAVMAMNNVYYRFVHLVSDTQYQQMPAGLRMSVVGNPGIEKRDFELYSLAVSAINGCGMCIDAHVKQVTDAGITKEGVQHSIRIAAVLSAAAQALIL